jgi:glucokinase
MNVEESGHLKQTVLVGDIGGTNARFGLVSETDDGAYNHPEDIRSYATSEYSTVYDAIADYLSQFTGIQVQKACLAIATPVRSQHIKMTNNGWTFSLTELSQRFSLDFVKLINDFTGLALSIPRLSTDDLLQVSDGVKVEDGTMAVLGAGTGLGVSGLLPSANGWMPIEGEGGHVTLGATTQREFDIFQKQWDRFGHMSAERLLSGKGICDIYQSICEIDNKPIKELMASEISALAISGDCETCKEVMDLFFGWLGIVSGNLALTLGAQGGVYIGGGIVPRLIDAFNSSSYLQRFEQKGRFSNYLKNIPVFVIMDKYPALTGAAYALDDIYSHLGVSHHANL